MKERERFDIWNNCCVFQDARFVNGPRLLEPGTPETAFDFRLWPDAPAEAETISLTRLTEGIGCADGSEQQKDTQHHPGNRVNSTNSARDPW